MVLYDMQLLVGIKSKNKMHMNEYTTMIKGDKYQNSSFVTYYLSDSALKLHLHCKQHESLN